MPNIGTQFINARRTDEYLILPFVPDETRFERGMNYAEIAPPGMSGVFTQYTQGGAEYMSIELFLNDLGRLPDDKISGQHLGTSVSSAVAVEGAQGALEWFETVRKGRLTIDGVHEPPGVMWLLIAGRDAELHAIRSYSGRIVNRKNRNANDNPGNPNRAYIRMELIGHHEIPRPTAAMRW